MDILVLAIAWLLAGCGIAWLMGGAISLSDAPIGRRVSPQDTVENFDHFASGELAHDDVVDRGAGFSAAAGTDRRQLRRG